MTVTAAAFGIGAANAGDTALFGTAQIKDHSCNDSRHHNDDNHIFHSADLFPCAVQAIGRRGRLKAFTLRPERIISTVTTATIASTAVPPATAAVTSSAAGSVINVPTV